MEWFMLYTEEVIIHYQLGFILNFKLTLTAVGRSWRVPLSNP